MNQILVTQKLYITPELKRKKKIYKLEFILSIFLVCILTSFYIDAEFDKNRGAEASEDILTEVSQQLADSDNTVADDGVLRVVVDENVQENSEAEETVTEVPENTINIEKKKSQSGYIYSTIAQISIPRINVNYGIIKGETGSEKETEELLKISPCRFWGSEPNEVGNFCIVGHNYRNTRFFSKVPTLVVGDIIKITDLKKRTLVYEVYDKYTVSPEDTRCTSQVTGGKTEITLITCTDDSKQRVIVKARE